MTSIRVPIGGLILSITPKLSDRWSRLKIFYIAKFFWIIGIYIKLFAKTQSRVWFKILFTWTVFWLYVIRNFGECEAFWKHIYVDPINCHQIEVLWVESPSCWVMRFYIVASELKDPIWHSSEWQIGSFSSEATICKDMVGKDSNIYFR